MIYFIGQNIHLTSLALHEQWWNNAMTGYLTWLAGGGFHTSIVEEVKTDSCPEAAKALPLAPKPKASRGKAKTVKKAQSLSVLETFNHS